MLISIIIPIYKVEEYLDECITSVVNQTYHELEIILVDDGSPDKCPMKCEEWAKRDSRIKVIHKKNGGLSDARNAGVEVACGSYISFVDSDDFIENTYIEKLYNALVANSDCSISTCSCKQYRDGKLEDIFNRNWIFSDIRYIEPNEYAERLLLMKSQHTAWGKLYKTDVLRNIRFRKGCVNEDTLFVLDFYPIVEAQKLRTVEIPDMLYYYRNRADSICKSIDSKFEKALFRNSKLIFEEFRHRNHKIFYFYYKRYLSQLCDFMMWELNCKRINPSKYLNMCLITWQYNNAVAKRLLNKSEYSTFLHGKYLGCVIWIKYKLKYLLK